MAFYYSQADQPASSVPTITGDSLRLAKPTDVLAIPAAVTASARVCRDGLRPQAAKKIAERWPFIVEMWQRHCEANGLAGDILQVPIGVPQLQLGRRLPTGTVHSLLLVPAGPYRPGKRGAAIDDPWRARPLGTLRRQLEALRQIAVSHATMLPGAERILLVLPFEHNGWCWTEYEYRLLANELLTHELFVEVADSSLTRQQFRRNGWSLVHPGSTTQHRRVKDPALAASMDACKASRRAKNYKRWIAPRLATEAELKRRGFGHPVDHPGSWNPLNKPWHDLVLNKLRSLSGQPMPFRDIRRLVADAGFNVARGSLCGWLTRAALVGETRKEGRGQWAAGPGRSV